MQERFLRVHFSSCFSVESKDYFYYCIGIREEIMQQGQIIAWGDKGNNVLKSVVMTNPDYKDLIKILEIDRK